MKRLELYFFPQCPYCQIVEKALVTTGLKKHVTYLNTMENPQYKEKLIKITGKGTVPCLFIDGKPMHESRDIAAWLTNYAKELSCAGDL
jgi:glutaredoxin 3